jgi:hypothetical protein
MLVSTHLMLTLLISYLKLSTRRMEHICPRQPMFRLRTSHQIQLWLSFSRTSCLMLHRLSLTQLPFDHSLCSYPLKRTLQATTQYARVPMSESSQRFFKSPFPALNVTSPDAMRTFSRTDVVYSDTPATDDGSTSAAVYSGHISHATYNVQVEWDNGEITYKPLTTIAADDPVLCAIYACDNNLLNTAGWKQFK